MALRLRRGTDAERLTIAPLSGELIYTTDTNKIYVGDGTTLGGNLIGPPNASSFDLINDTTPQLGGNLDLNGNNIVGTGNINITGTITATGNINLGDGIEDNVIVGGQISSNLVPSQDSVYNLGSPFGKWRNGFFNGLTVDGEISALSINGAILSDDSTIAFDPSTGLFIGTTFIGNTFRGALEGDVVGSLFRNDSSIVVDGETGSITTGTINVTSNALNLDNATPATSTALVVISNDEQTELRLRRKSDSDISGSDLNYGTISFEREDSNGNAVTSIITSTRDFFLLSNSPDSTFGEATFLTMNNGKFGFGTFTPSETLDVSGNAVVSGFVQFGSLTTTERNALTAANGMVIYNSTANRFQGYQNGGWINLDDGTAG